MIPTCCKLWQSYDRHAIAERWHGRDFHGLTIDGLITVVSLVALGLMDTKREVPMTVRDEELIGLKCIRTSC